MLFGIWLFLSVVTVVGATNCVRVGSRDLMMTQKGTTVTGGWIHKRYQKKGDALLHGWQMHYIIHSL